MTADQFNLAVAADPNIQGNASGSTGSKPANNISYLEAMKFANWLTSGTYNGGAYQFSSPTTFTGIDRAAALATYGLVYVVPSENEWYKAAYYKGGGLYSDYANGVDTTGPAPAKGAGGWNYDNYSPPGLNVGFSPLEQNGTYDMMGNIWEMTEGSVLRGGGSASWNYTSNAASLKSTSRIDIGDTGEDDEHGFRVASIGSPLVTGGYAGWAHDHAGDGMPGEDFNNDGVSNGVAYFMGMDGLATLPGVVDGKVTWPYVNDVAAYEVQVSDNLTDWVPATSGVEETSSPRQVIYTLLPSADPRKFCRLVVTP